MAVARFGKETFRNKNVNDIQPHTWNWLHDQMNTPGQYFHKNTPAIEDDDGTPMSRDQILAMAKLRGGGQKYFQKRPVAASAPAAQEAGGKWAAATTVAPLGSLPVGTRVAAAKDARGDWEYVAADGSSGVIPAASVAAVIQSVKKDGKVLRSNSPAELFDDTAKPVAPAPKAEPATEGNKYRIPENKISLHQKAVEESFKQGGDKNMLISALAGTGKTTLLRHLSSFKKPGEKWLYLVFNKKNQVEATTGKSPFPRDVEVKTTHSFLGKVLKDNSQIGKMPETSIGRFKKIGSLVDSDSLAEKAFDMEIPRHLMWPLKKKLQKVTALAKAFAVHPGQDAQQKIAQIMDQYAIDGDLLSDRDDGRKGKDYTPQIIALAVDLLGQSMPGAAEDPALASIRDHDDTLWYAATHADQIRWPHYDVVLADEVQDFNRAQLIMLQKLRQAGARVIAVGDARQSIYSFRGSDSQAFNNVKDMLEANGGSTVHELPVNYRSGKKIIDYVNRNTHVNNLVAGRDHDGEVTTHKTYNDSIAEIGKEWQDKGRLSEPTAFISRTNQPLAHTALNLLKAKIPFVILGREFSEELIKFVKNINSFSGRSKNVPIEDFWRSMEGFVETKKKQYAGKAKKQDELQEIVETSEALGSILDHLQQSDWRYSDSDRIPDGGNAPRGSFTPRVVRTTDDFNAYLKSMFSGLNANEDEDDAAKLAKMDPRKYVTLTTGHRSKGMEYERVYIVRPNQWPHPKAKTPDDFAQEENGRYVALTRATHKLHVLADDEPQPKKR